MGASTIHACLAGQTGIDWYLVLIHGKGEGLLSECRVLGLCGGPMAIETIACCTDFSLHAEAAFEQALDLAKQYGAKLFVIHVFPPVINPMLTEVERLAAEEPVQLMTRLQARMQKEYEPRLQGGVDYELVVLTGHVSSEIIRFLKKESIDVVVVGSYGLSGMGLVLFGSVAKRVARKAPCSVMIVREKEKGLSV